MANKLDEVAQAVAAAEQSRRHDAAIAKLKSQLKVERDKVKLAEAELTNAEERYELLQALGDAEKLGQRFERRKQTGRCTAILALCDWHCEETVDPAMVSGINKYDLKVAAKRIRTVCERVPDLLAATRHLSDVRELVVWLGGDLLTGYIHEELAESNALSPVEALIFLRDQVTEVLTFLLAECDVETITVPTSYGNHGRTTPKRRVSTGYKNSYEWLLYNFLAKDFAGEPRIKWKVERGAHNLLDVQGKVVRFSHGDDLRYQGGVGGLSIPVGKAIAAWDKTERADLDVFGHWHQFLWLRKFVACNCLIGYNAYARSIKAESSAPSQTYIVIDRNRPNPVEVREVYAT